MFWKLNLYLISFRHQFHADSLLTYVLVKVLRLIRLVTLIAEF